MDCISGEDSQVSVLVVVNLFDYCEMKKRLSPSGLLIFSNTVSAKDCCQISC